jgi:hypothetical protein
MTRTAPALLTGLLVVLLALSATVVAAAPDESLRSAVNPSEPRLLGALPGSAAMELPSLTDLLQPVALAALCAAALALFSAGPRASVRVKARRRK